MVRLTDLHEAGRQSSLELSCPVFDDKPFTAPKPLAERTVALISSAGLGTRDQPPFRGGDPGYRRFASDLDSRDILMSHISVNFDRDACISNTEAIFPRNLLAQLADEGVIKASSPTHYSFMGATDPAQMIESAVELTEELKAHGVDTAVLLPV